VGMTDTHRRILTFIRQFIAIHSYSPSMREIQGACEICSTSMVSYHLGRLRHFGYLTYERGKPRTIVLTGRG